VEIAVDIAVSAESGSCWAKNRPSVAVNGHSGTDVRGARRSYVDWRLA